jgi:hypothetical protein
MMQTEHPLYVAASAEPNRLHPAVRAAEIRRRRDRQVRLLGMSLIGLAAVLIAIGPLFLQV